jgi:undecaprenyl-diphosphatase
MSLWQAIVLAIVEGITEFLPISSTGHMIISSWMMGIESDEFVKMFTIAIQFGAILSVVVLYRGRFFKSVDFYLKLLVAFLPAAIIGFLLNDYIDRLLENVTVVAITLLAGGVVLVYVDKWFYTDNPDIELSYWQALKIGLIQVISMIPGISRSAATIIGGLSQGLNRKQAAEFSFFLAVPTMFAAAVYKLYKYHQEFGFHSQNIEVFVIGNLVAFIVAMLAIKGFIAYLTLNGFKIFGYYRIAVGLILLLLILSGKKLEMF